MEPRRRVLPLLAATVVGLAGSATASTLKLHGSNLWSNCRFSHRQRRPDRRAAAAGPVASAYVLREPAAPRGRRAYAATRR